MLGSAVDADDAVQATMIRAWKAREQFHGTGSVRSWLYRIATRVCFDALAESKRRMVPYENPAAVGGETISMAQFPREHWVEPIADSQVLERGTTPADQLATRQSIRLAFVVALQRLSAKERAALLLRDVLGFTAAETAECLEVTVAAANSALQRARANLDDGDAALASSAALSSEHDTLLTQYMDAFARYDIDAIVALLRDDVRFCMPPYELWFCEPARIAAWMIEHDQCRGSYLVKVQANGCTALAQYRPSQDSETFQAWALIAIETDGETITAVHNFLDVDTIFPRLDLPLELTPTSAVSQA